MLCKHHFSIERELHGDFMPINLFCFIQKHASIYNVNIYMYKSVSKAREK